MQTIGYSDNQIGRATRWKILKQVQDDELIAGAVNSPTSPTGEKREGRQNARPRVRFD